MSAQGPTNLTLVSQSLGPPTIVLGWTAAVHATSYNVYRDRKLLASGIVPATYTDSAVVAGIRYGYRVTAIVAGAETPGTGELLVDLPPAPNLTFEAVFQEQPGEGGYPDIAWRWQ